MITQDEAIQMAREAGGTYFGESGEYWMDMPEESIAAFANAVRRKTLLEAADECKWRVDTIMLEHDLRRMAEVE